MILFTSISIITTVALASGKKNCNPVRASKSMIKAVIQCVQQHVLRVSTNEGDGSPQTASTANILNA